MLPPISRNGDLEQLRIESLRTVPQLSGVYDVYGIKTQLARFCGIENITGFHLVFLPLIEDHRKNMTDPESDTTARESCALRCTEAAIKELIRWSGQARSSGEFALLIRWSGVQLPPPAPFPQLSIPDT